MTDEKKAEIQQLYSTGHTKEEICKITGIKPETLKKSIQLGKVILSRYETGEKEEALTKSTRSVLDDNQLMGKACINVLDRVLSSKTGVPSPVEFKGQIDLHQAGVLLSLPALLANGLLKYEDDFYPDTGYYSLSSVFISLAYLALLRIKTLAQSSSIPSGELGKAMGLDRIPEVKTLRERIALFCQKADIEHWGRKLSKDWLESHPALSGILYIDHAQTLCKPFAFVYEREHGLLGK
jgi:hypothetical protein